MSKVATFIGKTVQPSLSRGKHTIPPKAKPKAKPKIKPKPKEVPAALDISWDSRKKGGKLVIEADGVTVGHTGKDCSQSVASKARFDSGKWSFDIVVVCGGGMGAYASIGIVTLSFTTFDKGLSSDGSWFYFDSNGNFSCKGKQTPGGAPYKTGDRVSCIVDADAGTLEFLKNGKSQGTVMTGVKGPFYPAMALFGNGKGRIENEKQW